MLTCAIDHEGVKFKDAHSIGIMENDKKMRKHQNQDQLGSRGSKTEGQEGKG